LETGWGEHHPGNIWFGIKQWRPDQPFLDLVTREWVGGHLVAVHAHFAAYVSFAEAMRG
jgi:flagellum-specific peptidoglycan hydrolase FlgJ